MIEVIYHLTLYQTQTLWKGELEDPYILVHDKKINNMKDILPLLEKVVQSGKSILIIFKTLRVGLTTLVVNKLRGTFNVVSFKQLVSGIEESMLEDMAKQNRNVISEERGFKLESTTLDDLGTCKKVVSDKDNTTIVGGGGTSETISSRVNEIKVQIEKSKSDYDREKLQERLKLSGGVGIKCWTY